MMHMLSRQTSWVDTQHPQHRQEKKKNYYLITEAQCLNGTIANENMDRTLVIRISLDFKKHFHLQS
jgi:hypothetical protein